MRLIALGCRQFLEVDCPGFAIEDSFVVKAVYAVPSNRNRVQFLCPFRIRIHLDSLGAGLVGIHAEINCAAGCCLMQRIVGVVSPPHIRITGNFLEDNV